MEKAKYVYVTYINTTPEKLWNALTDPEVTKQYWGRGRNVSDWKPNSAWQHHNHDDPKVVDVVGQVIESQPPSRLVLTWASPAEAGDETKTSRVTFEIESFMESVKLTVIHDELEPGSEKLRAVSQGWPAILSSLKTLLETGQPLTFTMQRWKKR